ncbi:hypothetical protein Trydic_g1617 [Trypoxylus dichotomus]
MVHASFSIAVLPIGQMSEEVQEVRHKDCKRYGETYTRKTSRKDTVLYLHQVLVITFNPLISRYGKAVDRKTVILQDVRKLLKCPTIKADVFLEKESPSDLSSSDLDE